MEVLYQTGVSLSCKGPPTSVKYPVPEVQLLSLAPLEHFRFRPNPDSNGSASVVKAQVSPSR